MATVLWPYNPRKGRQAGSDSQEGLRPRSLQLTDEQQRHRCDGSLESSCLILMGLPGVLTTGGGGRGSSDGV